MFIPSFQGNFKGSSLRTTFLTGSEDPSLPTSKTFVFPGDGGLFTPADLSGTLSINTGGGPDYYDIDISDYLGINVGDNLSWSWTLGSGHNRLNLFVGGSIASNSVSGSTQTVNNISSTLLSFGHHRIKTVSSITVTKL